MRAGGSIQAAVDAAAPGGKVVVCGGVYAQRVRIAKDGITLEGRGAILDGTSLTGTRYGLTVADGVEDLTVLGFEIRNYRNLLASPDPSSGILFEGTAEGITIRNNTISANAWTGILANAGQLKDITIESNTFSNHRFTNILLDKPERLSLTGNVLAGGLVGVALVRPREASIGHNAINGAGDAGLVVTPAIGSVGAPMRLSIHNNTFSTGWGQAVWIVGAKTTRLADNTAASGFSLGGDADQLTLARNAASLFESPDVKPILRYLRDRGESTTLQTQSGAAEPRCTGLRCLWDAIVRFFDHLFPTASAQTSGSPPCTSTNGSCDPEALILYVVREAFNLPASPEARSHFSRLAPCRGQPDPCLTSAYFDAGDTSPTNSWTIPLGPLAELRFIDAGVQRDNETKARRHIDDKLDQNWTTIVLCRAYILGVAMNCAAAPRIFDFGLDLTHAPTDRARHISTWRMYQPSTLTHASFQRVHTDDATVFYSTSKVHHRESPPVTKLTDPLAPPPAVDPEHVVFAGTATLRCNILPSTDPLNATRPQRHDCQNPVMVKQPVTFSILACTGSLDGLAADFHQNPVIHNTKFAEETSGLWGFSRTCDESPSHIKTNWTNFFERSDLESLALAHDQYYKAGTDNARDAALLAAETVYLRAAGRHLALKVTTQGLPLDAGSTQNDAVILEWASGSAANLILDNIRVNDTHLGWVRARIPQLVSFTPANVTFRIDYRDVNGDLTTQKLELELDGTAPKIQNAPTLVAYEGRRLGSLVAWDADNLDYANKSPEASKPASTTSLG